MSLDLLEALDRIERRAKQARDEIRRGHATTGSSALRRIEEEAQDARRHFEGRVRDLLRERTPA